MLQHTGTVWLHKCCDTCVSAVGLELCMLLLHSCPRPVTTFTRVSYKLTAATCPSPGLQPLLPPGLTLPAAGAQNQGPARPVLPQ